MCRSRRLDTRRLIPLPDTHAVAPCRGDETVLLVEDEAGIRSYIRSVLEDQGYRVLDAANGAQAIEMARSPLSIDLLLTDIVLPGASGDQVIREFLAIRPGIPVLRMSGYPERFGAQIGGQTPYLQKPFRPEVLLAAVRNLLDAPTPEIPGYSAHQIRSRSK